MAFLSKLDLGNTWVTVTAEHGYGDAIEIKVESRYTLTTIINLNEPEEAIALGNALVAAGESLRQA